MATTRRVSVENVPQPTIDWLAKPDNPVVSVLARQVLLGRPLDDPDLSKLWAKRNTYVPVRRILEAMRADGSWADPSQDYGKYRGSLWQVAFLGELWADPDDERVQKAIEYAFSRQMPSGAWGPKPTPSAAAVCLTANVARSLARLGHAMDERVVQALAWIAAQHDELGYIGCKDVNETTLNGYCHMCAPKYLLFLAEVPEHAWPEGADRLRDACIAALRDKQVFLCLPRQTRDFENTVWSLPRREQAAGRERFIAENGPLEYREKAGWLRFGFPLHYNSDALEALAALVAIGEPVRDEYDAALEAVENAADGQVRWTMKNSLNGKMIADVEVKGEPSKWLTLRALTVLRHFGD